MKEVLSSIRPFVLSLVSTFCVTSPFESPVSKQSYTILDITRWGCKVTELCYFEVKSK